MEFAYFGLFFWTLISPFQGLSVPCALRDYGNDKRVCVCNSTYCDTFERVKDISADKFVCYISSKDGLRFNKTIERFGENSVSSDPILSWLIGSSHIEFKMKVVKKQCHKIHGFGGAFTDSAGINILSLGKQTQDKLMSSYFSETGIEYNLCRIPIGGTDFSTYPYSYDDEGEDMNLEHFSLVEPDYKYKIPLIQWANSISEKNIHFVAASWSPPTWMKTNNQFDGFAFLKETCYEPFAKYLIRFLDEYKKHNISIWAMSTGNEPSNGYLPVKRFNSLGWTPPALAAWTSRYFGPMLRNSTHNNTLILAFDDQRLFLPWWIELMINSDKKVLDYIDGFAVHWYWDFLVGPGVIDTLVKKYPQQFILYTEASQGDKPWEKKVDIGSWERGEAYLSDIIQNLNTCVTGWLDWNLALDMSGGPTWAKNYVDSPILVNAKADEFYKQPMFYALGHVSKFIERGAARVDMSPRESNGVQAVAVQNPDGRIVIVVLNKNEKEVSISINIPNKGYINKKLPPSSFATILLTPTKRI